MSTFYEQLQAGVLTTIDALKSTTVTVERVTTPVQEPDAPYVDGVLDKDTWTMDAVALGCEEEYVDGTTVLADDVQLIASAFATKDGVKQLFEPDIKDRYLLDGIVHVAHKIERIPVFGTPTCFLIFVGK